MSQVGGSRVALITNQFDAMRAFYAGRLGFNELETWDRPRARGIILQGPGSFRLELLDATREEPPRGQQHGPVHERPRRSGQARRR